MAKRAKTKTKKNPHFAESSLLLDCPECLSFISEKDINQETGIAKCNHCNHVFPFEEVIEKDPIGIPTHLLPDGVEVLKLDSFIEVKINHFKGQDKKSLGFYTFFSLMWNIMLIPFLVFIISSGAWQILIFISAHLAVGLSMLYKSISSLFNTTTIEVNKYEVSVKVEPFPLPWHRKINIPLNNIRTLSLEKSRWKNSGVSLNYNLTANLKNGKKKVLIPGLKVDTLKLVKAEIEQWLKKEYR